MDLLLNSIACLAIGFGSGYLVAIITEIRQRKPRAAHARRALLADPHNACSNVVVAKYILTDYVRTLTPAERELHLETRTVCDVH